MAQSALPTVITFTKYHVFVYKIALMMGQRHFDKFFIYHIMGAEVTNISVFKFVAKECPVQRGDLLLCLNSASYVANKASS